MIPLLHLYYKKNMSVEETKIHKNVIVINEQLAQSDNILLTLNTLLPNRDVRMKVLHDAMKTLKQPNGSEERMMLTLQQNFLNQRDRDSKYKQYVISAHIQAVVSQQKNHSKENEQHDISHTSHEKLNLYNKIIVGGSFLFLVLFNLFLASLTDKRFWIVTACCTFVIPTGMLILSYIHHGNLNATLTDEEELEALEKEIESETEILSTIPVLLFGLGIIYTQYTKADYITHTIAFLLLSILFGSIFPQLAKHMIFDHNNLTRMFVIEELIFSSIAVAFGLIVASMVIPLYIQLYAIDVGTYNSTK